MPDNSALLVFAGLVVVVAFAIAARTYIRAVNAVFVFLRGRGYTDWGKRQTIGIDSRFFSDRLVNRACLGVGVRDIPDEDYRLLLSAVRRPLLICFALFAVFVIGLGSLTQGFQ